jgi:transposase
LIRVDAVWLATEPIDMRAGTETALARVVKVFGAAQPHHAYLFANRRAKYADHVPLYCQETIFGRAGLAIPRSTLGAWVGACGVRLQPLVDALRGAILAHGVLYADETPVAMLKPGTGKTHRAYL